MYNAIIFGANGQDGYYLNKLLLSKGINVLCASRKGNGIHLDVSNYDSVSDIIKTHKPTYIFHLAANSTTHHDAAIENHATISTGTLNILESVKIFSPFSKVFLSGSGLQFVNNGLPIKETDDFIANSPYSVSRIHSVYAARYYRSLGIKVYVGYFFNHESPQRPERHMSKKIALFAKRISEGENERMEIGDISVRKEWTYAGDVVDAVYALVTQDEIFEATIGSGLAYSIQDWLNECFGIIDKDWRKYITEKSGFTPEYKILYSDPSTIKKIGWSQTIDFSSLAKMMVLDNE
jgi:GDPmannose 4,6-dehydratase